ncbi:MAG TPA: FimV domain-containing protein, partial [Acinetobacter sp.]|nr:FimV domain-containing protein [Acinetobacter sp.]
QPEVVEEKNELNFAEPETTTITESQPAASTSTQDLNDPLIQSFPDLQQLDEAQLNLDLAEQYIELGAFESARVLLENNALVLNAEQQQRSEKLLNKIAS